MTSEAPVVHIEDKLEHQNQMSADVGQPSDSAKEAVSQSIQEEPSEPIHVVSPKPNEESPEPMVVDTPQVVPEENVKPSKAEEEMVSDSVPEGTDTTVNETQPRDSSSPVPSNSAVDVNPVVENKITTEETDAVSSPDPRHEVKSAFGDTAQDHVELSSVDNKEQNESNSELGDKRSQSGSKLIGR